MKIIFDMETGDPDDFITLLMLCGHPDVDLVAVNVTPGAPDQIGVVRWALDKFGLDIPVGSYDINVCEKKDVQRVSGWHYRVYGKIDKSFDAEEGWEVLLDNFKPDTTLVTGGPLKNVGKFLENVPSDYSCGSIVVQGGFAGEGVVPAEKQLEKFSGLRTCPTFNLNGDVKSAKAVLASNVFKNKKFVSKNVCHGVTYDHRMHALLHKIMISQPDNTRTFLSHNLIYFGMNDYLKRKPFKAFHDPLAACCAIDNSVGVWEEVEQYRDKGKWGSKFSFNPNCEIIVDYDHSKFIDVLFRV